MIILSNRQKEREGGGGVQRLPTPPWLKGLKVALQILDSHEDQGRDTDIYMDQGPDINLYEDQGPNTDSDEGQGLDTDPYEGQGPDPGYCQ